jgi:cystathionine gamma-synthase
MTGAGESRLVHAGSDRAAGSPAVPPVYASSIFSSAGEPDPARSYGRHGNPTWEALEAALGAIENAGAVVFASGQAASMALMLALAEDGQRLLLPVGGFHETARLAVRLRPGGMQPAEADLRDLGAVERELTTAPAVLWAETPDNPLLRVADLRRLGELAAWAGAPMIVDNTVATGVLQQPLSWGATASVYSLSKAASGHSDVILGAVVTRDSGLLETVRGWRDLGGAIPGPFEAWLALRGLRTLHLRIARQSENALAIVGHLRSHPAVTAVHYPGLDPSTSEVAERQMPDGYGPLLSFELAGGAAAADRAVAASKLILPATSLGGIETSWERGRWPGDRIPDQALRRYRAGRRPDRRHRRRARRPRRPPVTASGAADLRGLQGVRGWRRVDLSSEGVMGTPAPFRRGGTRPWR